MCDFRQIQPGLSSPDVQWTEFESDYQDCIFYETRVNRLLGHPLGCTGAKLTVQILNEMRRNNQKYGMVTACVGGGQGIAGIYERLN